MTFSDRYLKSLKPREKQYYVREQRGFTVRVLPTGIKTFLFIYTIKGKRRQMNLGIYPDKSLERAHKDYLEAASLVKDGIDPQAPPLPAVVEPDKMTVTDLKLKYVEHIKTHLVERSVKHQDGRLEKHLIPAWGNRQITDIRRRDAIELIENIASKKPGAARNVLLAARAMFTYALRRELVEYNPFSEVGLAVPAAMANDRIRTLSDDELKKVVLPYLFSPSGNTIAKKALLLILVTGGLLPKPRKFLYPYKTVSYRK
jgi:hypothetical protein